MLLCALLAACTKWIIAKERETKRTLLAEMVAAAFVTAVVFCVYMLQDFSVYIGCLVTLGFGFGAVEAAERLSKHIRKEGAGKIGMPIDKEDEKEDVKK